MKWMLLILNLMLICQISPADTFTHRITGKQYHGYYELAKPGQETTIHTLEAGKITAKPSDFSIRQDFNGRNKQASLIRISNALEYEIETEAFRDAIIEEADKGPYFIIIDIDTPGGRLDLMMKMCYAITQIKNCPTIAFISGGPNGGAYSAGSAVALACNKIYMAPNTAIGGAQSIVLTDEGAADTEEIFGEAVAEKMSSITRNYFASLAINNKRPPLLAKAMENRNISVIEVESSNSRKFIDPADKQPYEKLVKTWSHKGRLLTLPAGEAVQCSIADGLVGDRSGLLDKLSAPGIEIVENTKPAQARELYEKVLKRFEAIDSKLDTQYQQILMSKNSGMTRRRALKVIKGMQTEITYLLRMVRQYPDLPYSEKDLQDALNSYKALYETIRSQR